MKQLVKQFFKFRYNYENKDSIILRDFLSLERTRLANERTLLSYLRTALYLLLGGFALLQFRDSPRLEWIGLISIILSGFFTLVGIVRFFGLKRQLHEFYEGQQLKAIREARQEERSKAL